MDFGTYVKDALRPGGTPSRYLIWVCCVLVLQTAASVVPSPRFLESPLNLSHYLLIASIAISFAVNLLLKTNEQKILAAYCLFIVGLAVTTITISTGITSLSGIIFMLTWAMTLFIAERREYISFDLVTLFMILMLISTVILLMFNPVLHVADNIIILATGGVLTAINIHLVYSDFGYDRNFYQESRRVMSDLQVLSSKLSDILTSEGDLDDLLWQVAEECVPFLGLEECVIYLYDEKKGRLVQKAAYGGKSDDNHVIVSPIELQPGIGIVGKVFATGKPILVEETKLHSDYVVDDAERNSELAVPIISNGHVIGVIDSEHTMKGFFLERHLLAFEVIASFCGIKIVERTARESIQKAEVSQLEASHYKELNELKSRFITNISHDLKTPLSLIKGPATQIANLTDDPQVVKLSKYIHKNTEHLLRVVGQLLQLNRVDKGLNELYLEEVRTDLLINKIADQYTGLAESNKVVFTAISDNVTIMTDAFRLEQIVHNLVHNAFRYTGKNGTINLSLEHFDDTIKISVSDNGPGIPKAVHHKIFERFYKTDENNHEGTGIGLSLVKEYTQSLQGKIEMTSEEGIGTTFEITLPIVFVQESEKSESDAPDFDLQDKPVLMVVEDHADLNDFICDYFESDFQCISAFDGAEALKKMETQTPDLIISDLMMPNMDGENFIKSLKLSDQFGHIPIVVLSARSQTDSRIDLYNLGVDNYIVKPFDINELSAVVSNTLENRKKILDRFHEQLSQPLPSQKFAPTATLNDSDTTEFDQTLLPKSIAFIEENLSNHELTVKLLSEHVRYGRNKFQASIKQQTGLTPVEFIRSVRLNKAKEMLTEGSLTVSEIAYSVGFNNLSYFTRSFKSEFGILPSEVSASIN